MDLPVGSRDHRENEFYKYRYSTRFQKGDIVEIRTGADLEMARFQARKSFPDVLNEYWWLKPSDIPAYKDLPFKVSDIYFYHGGVPVVVLLTAQGSLIRKTQVFLRKKDEPKNSISAEEKEQIELLEADGLCELLLDQNLLIRQLAVKKFKEKYPDFKPSASEHQIIFNILTGNYDTIPPFGGLAVESLIERLFVTSFAKETERIVDALIAIGQPALPRLEDISEFLSLMASPYYAKRINWTITQIKKLQKNNGVTAK